MAGKEDAIRTKIVVDGEKEYKGYACNLYPQEIKTVLGILRGLLICYDRRRAGNSGGGRRRLGFWLLWEGRRVCNRRHIWH